MELCSLCPKQGQAPWTPPVWGVTKRDWLYGGELCRGPVVFLHKKGTSSRGPVVRGRVVRGRVVSGRVDAVPQPSLEGGKSGGSGFYYLHKKLSSSLTCISLKSISVFNRCKCIKCVSFCRSTPGLYFFMLKKTSIYAQGTQI